jgi:PPOX class probable F420-dependent enzyme
MSGGVFSTLTCVNSDYSGRVGALPASARDLLESGALAHLVTLNPDGSPQVTCVWVGIDGDELVTAHLGAFRKVKNVQRDPRVALSIESDQPNPIGMLHYLVVYGRARAVEGGAPELLQRLAYTYVGPGVRFPPMDNPPPGYVLHITPERFGGLGPWVDG